VPWVPVARRDLRSDPLVRIHDHRIIESFTQKANKRSSTSRYIVSATADLLKAMSPRYDGKPSLLSHLNEREVG
jgi:hypothetical protein